MSYTINIGAVQKKDASVSINFDYKLNGNENENDSNRIKEFNEYLAVLRAEKIDYLKIEGRIYQKNGLPAIEYEITAEFTAECARCTKETPHIIIVRGEKYIASKSGEITSDNDSGNENGDYESDDYYVTETDGIINISEFMSEFLGLEVPFRYLCSEDCRGLCPKCGKDLNNGSCACPKKEKNPAFAVLDDFFKD